LRDCAQHRKTNQTKVPFRASNAVNAFKTIPEKYRIARNNFRYQNFRDIALSTLLGSDVHVIDAFRVTEPAFDLSEDRVHFPPWVYGELAGRLTYHPVLQYRQADRRTGQICRCLVLSRVSFSSPFERLFKAHARAGWHSTVHSITPPSAGRLGIMPSNQTQNLTSQARDSASCLYLYLIIRSNHCLV
jgi:hypothetical protein